MMKFNEQDRSGVVMLSEAKHLCAPQARPFAEFTLERSEGLRVTHMTNLGCYISLSRDQPLRLP